MKTCIRKLMTFNLHGWNQGSVLLRDLCEDDTDSQYDCLFVQEHWLTPDSLFKARELSQKYRFYGQSAMEHKISSGLLQGRPFGGAGIFIKTDLSCMVQSSILKEKFCALVLEKLILICVYCPSLVTIDGHEKCVDLISDMDQFLSEYPTHNIICGGDFNTNLFESSKNNTVYHSFMSKFNLIISNSIDINLNAVNYTYKHNTIPGDSYLDFFLVSGSIFHNIKECTVIDHPLNLSDHNPVSLSFTDCLLSNCDKDHKINVSRDKVTRDQGPGACSAHNFQLRWDHCVLEHYYNVTREMISPIYKSIVELESIVREIGPNITQLNNNALRKEATIQVEYCYDRMMAALIEASDTCVPKIRSNSLKHWWSEVAEELKQQSITTHRLWNDSGRPRNGPIFDGKNKAKLNYKSYLRQEMANEKLNISDSLHDSLVSKNGNEFWKIWRKKFGKKKQNLPGNINGKTDEKSIAEEFANFFARTPSTHNFNNWSKQSSSMIINPLEKIWDVELVDNKILKLAKGKTPGFDGISAEHLKFCHPLVVLALTKLFNLMLQLEFVPSSFGYGIIIPIPKKTDINCCLKVEDYRAITVSPVVSKVFEMCLLDDMKLFFESNERQFGFKKNVGCRDAIFALKSVVNYYTSNGSTVSICSIDITRAFDCVSHNKLWEIMSNLGFPSYIINILSDWYDKIWFTVKWGCEFFCFFNKLATGVKQGGILSHISFFQFILIPVLNSLTLSGLGCRIDGWCCNSFMYADDLILLAISNNNLIKLIKKCQSEFNLIGLEINANKSGAMKFGSRHSNQLNPLVVDNLKISWVKELVYLGVRLSSSNKFNVNPPVHEAKWSFL